MVQERASLGRVYSEVSRRETEMIERSEKFHEVENLRVHLLPCPMPLLILSVHVGEEVPQDH